MSGRLIRRAHVPLTDAAPLICAAELGFAAEKGLVLPLQQAPTWARLRDLLAIGAVDAAHMLLPLAVAQAVGLGPVLAAFEVPMVPSQGGHAIGAAPHLADRLPLLTNPVQAARAIHAAADGFLRVGVPFAFSTHALLMSRSPGDPPGLAQAACRDAPGTKRPKRGVQQKRRLRCLTTEKRCGHAGFRDGRRRR